MSIPLIKEVLDEKDFNDIRLEGSIGVSWGINANDEAQLRAFKEVKQELYLKGLYDPKNKKFSISERAIIERVENKLKAFRAETINPTTFEGNDNPNDEVVYNFPRFSGVILEEESSSWKLPKNSMRTLPEGQSSDCFILLGRATKWGYKKIPLKFNPESASDNQWAKDTYFIDPPLDETVDRGKFPQNTIVRHWKEGKYFIRLKDGSWKEITKYKAYRTMTKFEKEVKKDDYKEFAKDSEKFYNKKHKKDFQELRRKMKQRIDPRNKEKHYRALYGY